MGDAIEIIVKRNGEQIATFQMDERSGENGTKKFSSGKSGYHAQGKVQMAGKRFQGNFLLVEIGPKPQPAKTAENTTTP